MANEHRTRTDRLLALLLARKGRRVSLPEVQRAAGAQHGARIGELREHGYVIDNVMERMEGEIYSWYVLRAEPGETAPMFPIPQAQPQTEAVSRWELECMARRGRTG